jgi:predicted CoA-substrate-specific enzyme activase
VVCAGIDIGSTTTKVVFLKFNRKVAAMSIGPTGFAPEDAVLREIQNCYSQTGLTEVDVAYWVATGYGRELIKFADEQVTEITCHGKSAHTFVPEARGVIDMGGQDSKAISLDKTGRVVDFAMNDRCAAGTGKFLEVTARTMGISPEEMGRLSLQSTKEVAVSGVCTVFAEAEVISLVSKGVAAVDILAGINRAVVRRVQGLLRRAQVRPPYVMTGGVAKNIGVVRAFEELLQTKLLIPEEPQLVGALGAAYIALDSYERNPGLESYEKNRRIERKINSERDSQRV